MKPPVRSLSWPQRLWAAAGRARDYWTLSAVEVGLVLLVLFAFGYFFASGSWNQNARLDAIYSFVEPGPDQYTFRINRFIYDAARNLNTGDWARFGSDFYANKAPGTILFGVVVYWPLHWFETVALGFDPYHPLLEVANAYFINFGVSVTFAALGILCFWRLLRAVGVQHPRALSIALIAAFGTALFPYSTSLWSSATTSALVMAGYLGAWLGTRRSVAASGAALGFAVCSDYLASLFVLAVGVCLLVRHRSLFFWFCLGGVPALVVLLGYQYYCFHNPLTTASSLSQPGFLDRSRWLGMLGWPSPAALFQLTFGPRRGVFFQMPVLFLGLVGVYYWVRRDRTDLLLWLSGVSFVVPLVVVSAFNGWHGGASVCARYLVPALPWLCLSLKELPSSRRWSLLIACLGAISLLNMLAVAATNPVSPENVFEPLYTWVYPEFVAGNFGEIGQPTRLQALHPAWPEIAPLTCFNLGEVMGLSGYPSLLPWLLVCAAIGRFLYKRTAREAETPSVARQDQGAVGAD